MRTRTRRGEEEEEEEQQQEEEEEEEEQEEDTNCMPHQHTSTPCIIPPWHAWCGDVQQIVCA
jgi:hypothetical protein